MRENFCMNADAYKIGHWLQYPPGTKKIYSYLESRGGGRFNYTQQFGLQMILKDHFEGVVLEQWMIDDAAEELGEVFFTHALFNKAGWQRLLDKHKGYLPIIVKAAPEGLWIGKKNVLVTIENTDEEFPWLTNFCETILLHVWYPITVATNSRLIKGMINDYCSWTSDNKVSPFHLNDFGFRGVSSLQSAGRGGVAHLVNFDGTDTLIANVYARRYYNAPKGFGKSVFATEHSTTTSWGRDKELEAYRHFIKQCPEGIMSVVNDSYDSFKAVEMFGTVLKDDILGRGKETGFARFVVRPDSGDPMDMSLKTVQALDKYFGSTVNSKGYKVLNPKVGVIYGDGICYETISQIINNLVQNKYAPDNIVFGMGGALLQQCDRDTHKFAFKCSAALVGDTWVDVYKDPVTDKGKASKKGRLKLIRVEGAHGAAYKTVNQSEPGNDVLETVFENGRLVREYTFEEVRANARFT